MCCVYTVYTMKLQYAKAKSRCPQGWPTGMTRWYEVYCLQLHSFGKGGQHVHHCCYDACVALMPVCRCQEMNGCFAGPICS